MAENDGGIVLPNQGAPEVDTSQVTTGAGTVQRQRIAEADAYVGGNLARVEMDGARPVVDAAVVSLLRQILMELRMLNFMFREQCGQSVAGLQSSDFDLDQQNSTQQEH